MKNADWLQIQPSNNRVDCVKNGIRFKLKTSNNRVDKLYYSVVIFGYSVQLSIYTLWFCILKSLQQNVPNSHQKFLKTCIWDKFSLMGLTKQIYSTFPSPNLGQLTHPSTQNGMGNLTNRLVESISNLIYRLLTDYKKTSDFTSLVLIADFNEKSCFNGLLSNIWSNLNDSNTGPPRNFNSGSEI